MDCFFPLYLITRELTIVNLKGMRLVFTGLRQCINKLQSENWKICSNCSRELVQGIVLNLSHSRRHRLETSSRSLFPDP